MQNHVLQIDNFLVRDILLIICKLKTFSQYHGINSKKTSLVCAPHLDEINWISLP